MSLPMINYKHKNTEPNHELQSLIEQKLTSLEKYLGDETDQKLEIEFERMSSQTNGRIYRIEVNLWNGGQLYRAESTDDSFEKAVDEVRNELDKELRRTNKKKENLYRKGRRMIKDMMRFGQ